VAALACFCLLAIQLSGLHLHVDVSGSDAGLHGTHAHQVISSDHDHSAEVDVQLLEQSGISWSKLIPLISQVILLLTVLWIVRPLWSPAIKSGKSRSRLHWRPPLRAPPFSL
jgi:hypothetical protein